MGYDPVALTRACNQARTACVRIWRAIERRAGRGNRMASPRATPRSLTWKGARAWSRRMARRPLSHSGCGAICHTCPKGRRIPSSQARHGEVSERRRDWKQMERGSGTTTPREKFWRARPSYLIELVNNGKHVVNVILLGDGAQGHVNILHRKLRHDGTEDHKHRGQEHPEW
eukprot:scaffold122213_cov32-Tisochrysis_lutea.AAC.1